MYINIPGLYNSDKEHWQTIWENEYPDEFLRVVQSDWQNPTCDEWINRIEEELQQFDYGQLILIGHSVGCVTIIKWFEKYGHQIKGALFVAPSDVDKPGYPKYITGFSPMPERKLPFPSIVVASSNDHVVAIERARLFASNWGGEFVELENAGHIETKSGFGKWDFGLELLKKIN
ncbi:alpha/beta fold hydrolase [uncultured Pontibacter sp.]|uniref:RBBP9/YdeN family alpha/beta hydrolase n=1 Tax=uncultured Pontibacter sp. TaxID=453356 RepID=UPI0026180BB9|nr:alpha/beta fold hydrolase [uncultured Pontibacter sp.]